ncbi:MAG: hypothetical protein ACFKPT_23150 [Gloeotrichia echinulata GP01]
MNHMRLKNVVTGTNYHQVTQHEVKQGTEAQTDGLNIPDVAIGLTPIGLMFGWVIFFLMWRKLRTAVDNKMVFTIKKLHKVPCKNCKYYSSNHYLKCAVEPSLVMSEEAKNCSEYSPEKGKFSPKNLFGKDSNPH